MTLNKGGLRLELHTSLMRRVLRSKMPSLTALARMQPSGATTRSRTCSTVTKTSVTPLASRSYALGELVGPISAFAAAITAFRTSTILVHLPPGAPGAASQPADRSGRIAASLTDSSQAAPLGHSSSQSKALIEAEVAIDVAARAARAASDFEQLVVRSWFRP
jgi:hypothetical protein